MPHQNYLNWTWSTQGRLDGIDITQTPHASRFGELAKRLSKELEQNTLPFINLPFRAKLEKSLAELEPWVKGFKHMLVLGIGGSALGARAIQKAFFPEQDRPNHAGPWLWIADNVDSETLDAWLTKLPPKDTLVVVISKSGGTIETLGQYFLIKKWLEETISTSWKDNFLIVTDEKNGYLREEANQHQMKSLEVPDNLGGRYSALSAVGLVPAMFMGVDYKALLDGATTTAAPLLQALANTSKQDMAQALEAHPAWQLALWNRELMDKGYNQIIFFSYLPLWSYFGSWFTQLWAESLGKEGKGSMPITAVGVTDQHSTQQMFLDGPKDKACLFLSCKKEIAGHNFPQNIPEQWSYLRGRPFGVLLEAEALGSRMALAQSGVPVVEITMGTDKERSAGHLMMLLELTTLFTGWLLDINPLDQPAVELGKRLANAKLGAKGYDAESADLAAFLAKATKQQTF